MTDLEERFASLRTAVSDATVGDFDDVLARRRRTQRRRRAAGAIATAVVVAGVAAAGATGGFAGRQSVLERPVTPATSPATPSPGPSTSAPPPAPPGFEGAAVTFTPDGSLVALAGADCRGQGPASCQALLERSTDGGATWRVTGELPPFSDSAVDSLRLLAPTASDLWAQTDINGGLRVSHDNGRSWHAVQTPTVVAAAAAPGRVWALTCPSPTSCQVRTGPATADSLPPARAQPYTGYQPTGLIPPALAVVDADHALVAQTGVASYAVTADGGRSWAVHRLPCALGFGSVAGTSDGTYWLVCAGEPGAGKQPKQLYRSVDLGATWQHEPDPEANSYATHWTALDAKTAWRTGSRGASVYLTADGGQSWQAQPFGHWFGGAGPDAFTAHGRNAVAIRQGIVYYTADRGGSWLISQLASGAPRSGPAAVVTAYYQAAAHHDSKAAAALLAPEIRSMYSDFSNLVTLTDLRHVHTAVVPAPSLPPGYIDITQVSVAYTATYKKVIAAGNGTQTRFLYVGRRTADGPWRILSIGTGP